MLSNFTNNQSISGSGASKGKRGKREMLSNFTKHQPISGSGASKGKRGEKEGDWIEP